MSWLENLVVKLAGRVEKQIDALSDDKAFLAAQEAMAGGDHKTALAGFEALAERNHPRASTLAGTMYLMGQGTRENGGKAVKYLEIGKHAGDQEAVAMLGMMYAAGKAGVRVDYLKARPLLEAAAKNGDAKARQMLAHVKARQKGGR